MEYVTSLMMILTEIYLHFQRNDGRRTTSFQKNYDRVYHFLYNILSVILNFWAQEEQLQLWTRKSFQMKILPGYLKIRFDLTNERVRRSEGIAILLVKHSFRTPFMIDDAQLSENLNIFQQIFKNFKWPS